MQDALCEYVADRVLDDIRRNDALSNEIMESCNTFPLIDRIRRKVREEDIDRLISMANSKSIPRYALAVSLLQPHHAVPRVRAFFLEQWSRWTDFPHRFALLWRVLDGEGIGEEVRRDIHAFVTENLNAFLEASTRFCGGPDQVLDRCRARLSDPSFRREKDWIYLYVALAARNSDAAADLILRHTNSESVVAREVAADALARLRESGHEY